MIRRLSFAIVAFLALAAQAFGAGSIQLSLSQQFDAQGRPLSGGQLYFFVAGTTTPQNSFQDTALTIPYPNPITLDASGRVPPFYLADGLIKIRLATSAGVTVIAADNLLVVGASSGGGGGGSIDATTILATGDVKARYGVGTLTGFVRANGRTIGSATSGATERANADTQTLFEYLWNTDASLVVSSGRGATSIADWTANKTIALPDMRGRTIAGMDDMGTTASNRLTSTFFGVSGIVLGQAGGAQGITLTTAQIPAHQHTGTATGTTGAGSAHSHGVTDPTHVHGFGFQPVQDGGANYSAVVAGSQATRAISQSLPGTSSSGAATGISINNEASHTHPFTSSQFTTDPAGGGAAHATVTPTMIMTFYMKL
jgi:microcystin-dependent protein